MMKILMYKIVAMLSCILFISASLIPVGFALSDQLTVNDVSVDVDVAYAAAGMILAQMDQTSQRSVEKIIDTISDKENVLGYVFSLKPTGYIVLSAYRTLPMVIAYSFTNMYQNPFQVENPLRDLIRSDLKSRFANIDIIPKNIINNRWLLWNQYLKKEPIRSTASYEFQQWPSLHIASYGGWLETTWSQNDPFNKFCPIDLATHNRSVAGCPAVTMAQILNYHQTTNNVMLNDSDDYYHNYSDNNYWIDNDSETYGFPAFPELNSYLSTLVSHYQNQVTPTDDDIAALIFACGVAAKQVYHPTGSGTFGVNQALQAYHRFGFNNVELLDDDDQNVYDRLKADMKNALPAHLAVVNEDWTTGHNLVVDGYNTNDYYHLNFGWSGYADGWYLLPQELPYDLTVLEGVIVNITDVYDGSYLKGTGVLNWVNVIPGATTSGSFTIENNGIAGQGIDWEIVEYPSWGEWTFTPDQGENLRTEDGPVTIEVTVATPSNRTAHFAGHITIARTENKSDFCVIHASLTTPRFFLFQYFFLKFLNNHPHLFPFLRNLINY
ncbi:MAG: C10 family peptidase [Euryarchaeota archaeon]|nr:C10 family peptidase [Euryarchaeota archaeon]